MFKNFYNEKLFGEAAQKSGKDVLKKEITELQIESLRADNALLNPEETKMAAPAYEELTEQLAQMMKNNLKLAIRENLLPRDVETFIRTTCGSVENAAIKQLRKMEGEQ